MCRRPDGSPDGGPDHSAPTRSQAPPSARARRSALLGALLLLALGPTAPAGAEWKIAMRVTGEDGAEKPGRIYLDGDDLRLEVDAEPAVRVIFRGDGPALYHLDAASRTYTVMDRATAERVSEEWAAARRAMELQLAALPPEQRAALERMMPSPPAPAERPQLAVVETDRTRQVDGRSCRIRELRRDGEPSGELCVIDWDEAGISRTDLRAFRDMARFQQDLVREAAGPFASALASQPFDAFEELDGYPVESRTGSGPGGRTTMALPRKQETDPSRYRPPEDWTRRALVPAR